MKTSFAPFKIAVAVFTVFSSLLIIGGLLTNQLQKAGEAPVFVHLAKFQPNAILFTINLSLIAIAVWVVAGELRRRNNSPPMSKIDIAFWGSPILIGSLVCLRFFGWI